MEFFIENLMPETASDGLELLSNAAAAAVSGARRSYVRAYASDDLPRISAITTIAIRVTMDQMVTRPTAVAIDSLPSAAFCKQQTARPFPAGLGSAGAVACVLIVRALPGRSEFDGRLTGNGDPVRVQIRACTQYRDWI